MRNLRATHLRNGEIPLGSPGTAMQLTSGFTIYHIIPGQVSVCFPRCHLDGQHTCMIFRGEQGKQRRRGWVQRTNRKPNRDIWSSSWKKQNSPSHVSAEGTSEATVFLCALQTILWFLQSSFWVMAFKHHLSPSQLSTWKAMCRGISAHWESIT